MVNVNTDYEVVHCCACGDLINPGDYFQVYTYKGKEYFVCDYEDCKANLLLKFYEYDFEIRKRLSDIDYREMWEGND